MEEREGLPSLHFLPPEMSDEDLRQERELAKILGKKGPKKIPGRSREMAYGLYAPDEAKPVWLEDQAEFDPEAAEQLVSWFFRQSIDTQAAVIQYLEEPDGEALSGVLETIDTFSPKKKKERIKEFQEGPKEITLTDLIMHNLPATKDELYALARKAHRAERPEAAVRQILRRLTRKGTLKEDSEGRYYDAR